MGKYEQPLLITYGFSCPYHQSHQFNVLLAEKPHPNKVIGIQHCYPDLRHSRGEPTIITKLYGSLRLEAKSIPPSTNKAREV